jgi:hypothetical protein
MHNTGVRLTRLALAMCVVGCTSLAWAQGGSKGAPWNTLNAAQKSVLAPLQNDWAGIDGQRQQKWLEMAARFPSMPAEEQTRIKERMAHWSQLTPTQRNLARQQFQEARELPPEQRSTKWQEYQALTVEEREALARQGKPAARVQAKSERLAQELAERPPGNAKRNVVSAPVASPSKVVGAAALQAKPGATTNPITTRVTPPLHHQAGLPKIAATPGFVDPSTLLPKRGPQGAAVQALAASAAASAPGRN